MNIENTVAQMKKGILEMCVLSIISKQKSYPTEIIQQLKSTNLLVLEGTLYPLLARLQKSNFVDYEWIESSLGPPRKYYCITSKGFEYAVELKNNWDKINESVQINAIKLIQNEKNN